MRRRREYGEIARLGSDLARGRGDVRDLWRLCLCQGIRHRAQMAGSPPLPDCADLDQPDPRLSRPARPGDAPLVLKDSRRTENSLTISLFSRTGIRAYRPIWNKQKVQGPLAHAEAEIGVARPTH